MASDFDKLKSTETEEEILERVNRRVCPDITSEDLHYMVKNSYSNTTERDSFSIEIRKCLGDHCKNETEINSFLLDFYFTQYVLTRKIRFNSNNYGLEPIQTIDRFFAQFQVSLDRYRDNNNDVRINYVSTKDKRGNFMQQPLTWTFIDITQNPAWIGSMKV